MKCKKAKKTVDKNSSVLYTKKLLRVLHNLEKCDTMYL